jgi:hypothetical protein
MELLNAYLYSAEMQGAILGGVANLAMQTDGLSGGNKPILKRVLTAATLGLPVVFLMNEEFVPAIVRTYGTFSVGITMYLAYNFSITAGIAKQIEDNVFGAILDKIIS